MKLVLIAAAVSLAAVLAVPVRVISPTVDPTILVSRLGNPRRGGYRLVHRQPQAEQREILLEAPFIAATSKKQSLESDTYIGAKHSEIADFGGARSSRSATGDAIPDTPPKADGHTGEAVSSARAAISAPLDATDEPPLVRLHC